MKKGFTLVELSIVLVIIGLLIGGILVGQSLIKSAKTNSEIRKLTQYSIAAVSFTQKFKQHAGDSSYFTPAGDADGQSWEVLGSCPATYLKEGWSAWAHLTQAGMIKETYVWDSADACNWEGWKSMAPTTVLSGIYTDRESPLALYARSDGYNLGGKKYYRRFETDYDWETVVSMEKKFDDGIPSSASNQVFRSYTTDQGYECDYNGANQEATALNASVNDVQCFAIIHFSPTSAPELPLTSK